MNEQASSHDDIVARQGVGRGMGWEAGPPVDRRGWGQCPDCHVWYRKAEHAACPNCGYVFGQDQSDTPAPALDDASLRAARSLLEAAGSLENARIALDKASEQPS